MLSIGSRRRWAALARGLRQALQLLMNRYNPTLLLSLLSSSALIVGGCGNVDPDRTSALEARGRALPTPMDQGNGPSDIRTTQEVREALIADESLSFVAKNVAVITKNGTVTLRGRVRSELERENVEAKAQRLAGLNDVDSRLELDPTK